MAAGHPAPVRSGSRGRASGRGVARAPVSGLSFPTVRGAPQGDFVNITVIGSGYVGLVAGACLAETGNSVICADVDAGKIEGLQRNVLPIYEPGLDSLVERNQAARRLSFTTDIATAIAAAEVVFIAVGTPPDEDGSADLRHVLAVAEQIGRHMRRELVVVTKSTVPVGTAAKVSESV